MIILTSSCSDYYTNSIGVRRPKKFNFKLSPEKMNERASIVDTLNLYKLNSTWNGDKSFDSKTKKDYILIESYKNYDGSSLTSDIYVRFYNNGRVSFFNAVKDKKLERSMFNPEKGVVGVFEIRNDIIHIERFMHVGHKGTYLESRGIIKRDTLHVIEKVLNYHKHHIYIKREIPDRLLFGWKANW